MKSNDGTFIVGGQARLPKELLGGGVLQVIAKVDPAAGKVLEVDIIPCPVLVENQLRPMLVGVSLRDDLSDVLLEIDRRLFHKSKKAIMVAIKDMAREYRERQLPERSHLPSTY